MRLIPFSVHRIPSARGRILPCIELITDDFGNEIDLDDATELGYIDSLIEENIVGQSLHFLESRFYDVYSWTILQDEETDPEEARRARYLACVVH